MKSNKHLSTRFILRVLIILLIGQSFIWYWSFSRHMAALEDSLRQRVSMASTLIRNTAATAIVSYDYAYLEQIIDEVTKDEDIVSIEVYDKDGKPTLKRINGQNNSTIQSMDLPVMAGAQEVGRVTILYKQAKTDVAFILTNLILQGVVFVVLTLLIYLFFQKYIGTRIEGLSKSIEKVTLGDLTQQIEIIENDEIGTIAKGLDFLIDRLSSTVKKIKGISRNVSAAISQLNLTFKNVIDGINKQTGSSEEISSAVRNASESQKQIIDNTEKLLSLSNDNVSALLELKSNSEEIAVSTDNLNGSITNAYSAVTELTRSAQEVASMSGKASSAVEDASVSVEEVNTSIKEVEKIVKESAELSNQTTDVISEHGMLSVVEAIEGMERIEASVNALTAAMEKLDRRSKDIEKILSVIREVTEQTGLLSLNAQILSVQAGEYGKSFSVVADEMRALSEKTAVSTREIATIVSTLQKEIKGAVEETGKTFRMVAEGSQVVFKVGDALREMLHASQKTTDMSKSIERAAAEQTKGLELIVDSIGHIKRLILDVSRATDEQEKGTSYLLENISSTKESMEFTMKATDEQAENTRFITNNIELANEKTAEIAKASSEQEVLNERIIKAMEEVTRTGKDTVRDVKEVSLFISSLHDEVEALRQEMELFRTDNQ